MPKSNVVPFRNPLSYIISVSLETGCYRHIQIGADSTLEQLHEAIMEEFDFDDDHLHAFFMSNRGWDHQDCYFSKHADEGPFTDEVTLINARLAEGKKFLYIFDFGEEWRFNCRVLHQLEVSTPTPICVRSKGDPPAQYDDEEDLDEDEEWDEDEEDFEEQLEQLRQIWKQFAIKTAKPTESLRDMLDCREKAELVQLLESFGAKKISRWSKDKLIEGIAGFLIKPEVLRERLLSLGQEQWNLFRQAVDRSMLEMQESEVDLCAVPHILGLLQPYRHNEQYLCVVPQEIREVFSQLLTEGLQEDYDRRWLLHTYAMAAVNLYGIIPVEEFIGIFNSQNPLQADFQEISTTLCRSMLAHEALYGLWEGNKYLVHEALWAEDFAAAEDLLAVTEGKPRYIPPRDELLLYADMDYYEQTPQIKAVGTYFTLCHGITTDEREELLEQLHMQAFFGHQPDEMLELLADKGIMLDIKQLNEYLALITEVFNNTRIWLNKGHTPAELHRPKSDTTPPTLRLAIKVGRNDPCPCGSGKKYKHCCGR